MKLRSLVGLFLATAAAVAPNASGAADTYLADPARSSVRFSVRHFFTQVQGSFTKFTATLTFDRAHPENSAAHAVIEISSVKTGETDRDAHLQNQDFFDAPRFPTIIFTSTAWKKTEEDTFDVTGKLTIKGTVKEIVLHVKNSGAAAGAKRPHWEAATKIKRADFGVSAFPKFIGDDVNVAIHLELVPKD